MRRLLPLALVTAAVLLTVLIATGAKPQDALVISPLALAFGNRTFDPVEQHGFIENKTGCPWDPDDGIYGSGSGYLDPGASASVTACRIIDLNRYNQPFVLQVQGEKGPSGAQAFSAQITVEFAGAVHANTYRFTHDTPLAYTSPIKSNGTVMRERLCVYATYNDDAGAGQFGLVQTDPDGVGVRATVTYTVTNLSARREWFSVKASMNPSIRASHMIGDGDLCDNWEVGTRNWPRVNPCPDCPRVIWNVGEFEVLQ